MKRYCPHDCKHIILKEALDYVVVVDEPDLGLGEVDNLSDGLGQVVARAKANTHPNPEKGLESNS